MTTTFPLSVSNIKKVIKIPSFRTGIINYGNKVEQRISWDSSPRDSFTVHLRDVLSDEIIDQVLAFFEARKGRFEAFYFQSYDEAYRLKKWTASGAYVIGNIVRPVTPNGRSYKCTVAGTSNSVEPTWPTTVGGTVVDGTATWKENTYLVRFEADIINIEYFRYKLAYLKEIDLIEVNA